MEATKFISIFFMLNCGILGNASKEGLPPKTLIPIHHPSEPDTHRISRQLQLSQNIYPSKNFIESKLPQNNGQPQLFNLGYSVRFENQKPQNVKKTIEKSQFTNTQNGDIITGTRKQNVEIDIPTNSNDISQFIIKDDNKKRKAFGSKLTATSQSFTNTYLENMGQSYISQTTQKSLEELGKIKDVDHQQELSDLYQQKYTWRNLSPNAKIIRSTEIPTERIENRALNFDHEKALSKSEGFGFSDAMKAESLDSNIYSAGEPKVNHVKKAPTTPVPEEFRVIHVQEQINEPPMKTKIITDPGMFTSSKKLPQETVYKNIPQSNNVQQEIIYKSIPSSQIVQQETIYKNLPQIQPQTKVVKLSPTPILQAVDGTPLNPQVHQEVIMAQMPKQGYIQHLMVPQVQHDSMPKYRGKHKYFKHVQGTRGSLVYPRNKMISNFDHLRKGKIKPELRREFKPPPNFE